MKITWGIKVTRVELKNLLLVFLCLLSTLVLVGCDVIKDIVGGYDELN